MRVGLAVASVSVAMLAGCGSAGLGSSPGAPPTDGSTVPPTPTASIAPASPSASPRPSASPAAVVCGRRIGPPGATVANLGGAPVGLPVGAQLVVQVGENCTYGATEITAHPDGILHPAGQVPGTAGGVAAVAYSASRPGTTMLVATQRPRCSPGTLCPQHIIVIGALTVTVTG